MTTEEVAVEAALNASAPKREPAPLEADDALPPPKENHVEEEAATAVEAMKAVTAGLVIDIPAELKLWHFSSLQAVIEISIIMYPSSDNCKFFF